MPAGGAAQAHISSSQIDFSLSFWLLLLLADLAQTQRPPEGAFFIGANRNERKTANARACQESIEGSGERPER